MLLDRLLANVSLDVAPFAVCDIRRGSRLRMAAERKSTLHFVLQGHGQLVAGRSLAEMGPYTLALIPPGLDHHVTASDGEGSSATSDSDALRHVDVLGVERITQGSGEPELLMACGALRAELSTMGLFEPLRQPLVECFSESQRVRSLFEELFREQRDNHAGSARMIQAIMMQCLIHLMRRVLAQDGTHLGWLTALRDPELARALDAMLAEPGAAHSLESLAATAGMSRSSFSAHFASSFAKSPMAFLREVRLNHAARLLRTTDEPVKSIAGAVGFSSRSHFSRAFKEQFGRDPADYRGEDDAG